MSGLLENGIVKGGDLHVGHPGDAATLSQGQSLEVSDQLTEFIAAIAFDLGFRVRACFQLIWTDRGRAWVVTEAFVDVPQSPEKYCSALKELISKGVPIFSHPWPDAHVIGKKHWVSPDPKENIKYLWCFPKEWKEWENKKNQSFQKLSVTSSSDSTSPT